MSVSIHDVVFRDFKDFEPHAGTPIDIMHNMESGMMADLLEVRIHRYLLDTWEMSVFLVSCRPWLTT